jgi:protein TonB
MSIEATGRPLSGADARAATLAVCFTLALFLLLPYVHLVVPAPPPSMQVIEIPVVSLPAAPPALPPPEQANPSPPTVSLRQPELAVPLVQAVPLTPVLDFDFSLGGIGGDFGLAFSVEADAGAISGAGIFELAEVDSVPQAVVQMRPFYPAHARRRRIEGEVTVVFTVNTAGRTGDIRVVASAPDDLFTEAATRAVGRWRFTPAKKDGEAVPVRVRQVIRFRMEE